MSAAAYARVMGDGAYITEKRKMIRNSTREFTLQEVLPVANDLEPVQGEIPHDLRDKLADMGYFGIRIPQQYGGSGLACVECCPVTEQLARGWLLSVASIITRSNGTMTINLLSDAQKEALLPPVVTGEYLGAMSLSEPDTDSDLASISCRAERDGNDWVINGSKYWCTFSDGADYIVLFARTSPPPDGERRHLGIRAFIIDKQRGSLPAGVKGSEIPKIGYFGWKTWELAFDGFRVLAVALIGEAGKAFYALAKALDEARAHTAARSIGVAQGGLECPGLRAGTRAVRPSDCGISNDSLQTGADGNQDRIRASAAVFRLRQDRFPRALREGSRDGEVLRQRNVRARNQRVLADPRRRRLHQALHGRALLV